MAAEAWTETKFNFQHLPDKKLKLLEERETKDLLQKWSLLGGMKAVTFGYDQYFQLYHAEGFFSDFFSSQAVGANLEVLGSGRTWRPIGCRSGLQIEAVPVACTVLSMDYFDRLSECGVVRQSGDIRKCFDEYLDDFTISDELRKVLLMEDFEHYSIFRTEDREEFIFKLFTHICLGGSVCQFEDQAEPYLGTTKSLYKSLVSVVKDSKTAALKVASHVYKLSIQEDGLGIFPSSGQHVQSFAYAILDPVKRHVTVLSHDWNYGF